MYTRKRPPSCVPCKGTEKRQKRPHENHFTFLTNIEISIKKLQGQNQREISYQIRVICKVVFSFIVMACTGVGKCTSFPHCQRRQMPITLSDESCNTSHLDIRNVFPIVTDNSIKGCGIVNEKSSSQCLVKTAFPCRTHHPRK